jgi:hypothetical protein
MVISSFPLQVGDKIQIEGDLEEGKIKLGGCGRVFEFDP